MPLSLVRRIVPLCLALACFVAAAHKPLITVRFFLETNARDTETFASPVQLSSPPRAAFIEKAAAISETDISGIFPFLTNDGTWGCLFELTDTGRRNLEMVSAEKRGRSIVAFVGTKKGIRQVVDMVIDRRISDGIVTIQHGIQTEEIALLRKTYHTVKPLHETQAESPNSRRFASSIRSSAAT
jgi:hypothetical protein